MHATEHPGRKLKHPFPYASRPKPPHLLGEDRPGAAHPTCSRRGSSRDRRKRGVKSPDRAEAVILAFAEIGLVPGVLEYFRREAEKIRGRDSLWIPVGQTLVDTYPR